MASTSNSPAVITDEIRALTVAEYPADWTDVDTRAVDTARLLAADVAAYAAFSVAYVESRAARFEDAA